MSTKTKILTGVAVLGVALIVIVLIKRNKTAVPTSMGPAIEARSAQGHF